MKKELGGGEQKEQRKSCDGNATQTSLSESGLKLKKTIKSTIVGFRSSLDYFYGSIERRWAIFLKHGRAEKQRWTGSKIDAWADRGTSNIFSSLCAILGFRKKHGEFRRLIRAYDKQRFIRLMQTADGNYNVCDLALLYKISGFSPSFFMRFLLEDANRVWRWRRRRFMWQHIDEVVARRRETRVERTGVLRDCIAQLTAMGVYDQGLRYFLGGKWEKRLSHSRETEQALIREQVEKILVSQEARSRTRAASTTNPVDGDNGEDAISSVGKDLRNPKRGSLIERSEAGSQTESGGDEARGAGSSSTDSEG